MLPIHGDDKFRSLLEAAPDAMVIVDGSGTIVLVNTQAEHLFGYERREMLGQRVEMLVPSSVKPSHHLRRNGYMLEPHVRPMGADLTLHGRRKDGSEVPVEISLSPLETDEGRLVTAAIRDVTDRRQVERALYEKNVELETANRTKDRFLATMSHELRTPLNAVIGFTGTLLMRLPGPLTDDQESQLRTVQSSAQHLLALINDLLDLAKIESGKIELRIENVSCDSVIQEVTAALKPAAATKKLSFGAVNSRADIVVSTDRRALHQILLNLVGNAIKFTEEGGVGIMLTESVEDGGAHVRIGIVDTGIGIREEDASRLFEAFEQLGSTGAHRHEGSGLGLHLSQKLSKLVGARIEFESVHGRGSTFTLILPKTAR